ncbi:MAG: purine biosynthesis protein PurH [Clostridia bacterium]|nr:purine biosynthesis protein PurH [Clostridia bacterium]MBQ2948958.1 purine biosynthesis protein PurH [Clostridia bacterium]MBQ4609388.1 purine biosynthesis protein PurH [Clostridia bacterium]MBQ6857793.1 purine biosynthesis protein PurH [Clostridia bacterium]MBQ7051281.1 purine biosynthesis protein PurH [Clostridia bacterium]
MSSILIKDTTRKEREQIVEESLGGMDAACDGCSAGLYDMYQDYIDGRRELREINEEYRARYVSGREGPSRSSCMMM